jgi:hypothetical protein
MSHWISIRRGRPSDFDGLLKRHGIPARNNVTIISFNRPFTASSSTERVAFNRGEAQAGGERGHVTEDFFDGTLEEIQNGRTKAFEVTWRPPEDTD